MADSGITKRALAASLKELMEEKPLEKISISEICGRCGMHRKSFYYHFMDKYDLVNWIYDTEFLALEEERYGDDVGGWEYLHDLCYYLYDHRMFYRRALCYLGQNSFSEHFQERLRVVVSTWIRRADLQEGWNEFQINFLADGITFTIQQWIAKKDCMQPEEFLQNVKLCIKNLAVRVYEQMEVAADP